MVTTLPYEVKSREDELLEICHEITEDCKKFIHQNPDAENKEVSCRTIIHMVNSVLIKRLEELGILLEGTYYENEFYKIIVKSEDPKTKKLISEFEERRSEFFIKKKKEFEKNEEGYLENDDLPDYRNRFGRGETEGVKLFRRLPIERIEYFYTQNIKRKLREEGMGEEKIDFNDFQNCLFALITEISLFVSVVWSNLHKMKRMGITIATKKEKPIDLDEIYKIGEDIM